MGAQPWQPGLSGSGLVTGEAVLLDVPVSGPALRLLSSVIDAVLYVLVLAGVGRLAGPSVSGLDGATAAAASLLIVVGATVGLPTLVETLTRGRTLGKVITGLRVVRDDFGPITFRHALTRALIGFVEGWLPAGVVALVAEIASPASKRLGDMAAGTVVVRTRVRLRLTQPPAMPPYLAGWAVNADLALPDTLAVAVRQFLGRAEGLSPAARGQLLDALAGQVSATVAPPPPPGTPPWDFLVAVLAERRRRESMRLDHQRRYAGSLMQRGVRGA